MPQINLVNYNKKIGKKVILDNVTYQFDSGMIYGLLGRNGSGKTMILRAISGLIFPTSGAAIIDGKTIHKDIDFPPSTGIIIENTDLLPQYTAYENLKILARINKIADKKMILDSLKLVGLEGHEYEKVKAYSLGMRQKLSIAQAIFEKPSLLLLDEPTNALDEDSVTNIRNILLSLKEQGATILIASHNSEDLEILADTIVKVSDGKIQQTVKGSGFYYTNPYGTASKTTVYLTAENNNFSGESYKASGAWDEETR